MRKPRKGINYIMMSDGDLRTLWTAKSVGMAPLARRASTYARMTLDGIIPEQWESPRQPPPKTRFLLIGTAECEEIWKDISETQASGFYRWLYREFGKDAVAQPKPS